MCVGVGVSVGESESETADRRKFEKTPIGNRVSETRFPGVPPEYVGT